MSVSSHTGATLKKRRLPVIVAAILLLVLGLGLRLAINWWYSPDRQLAYFLADIRRGEFERALQRISQREIEGVGLSGNRLKAMYWASLARAGGTRIGKPYVVPVNATQFEVDRIWAVPILDSKGKEVGYQEGERPASYLHMYYTGSEWKVALSGWIHTIARLTRDDRLRPVVYEAIAREAGVHPMRYDAQADKWVDASGRRHGNTEADRLIALAREMTTSQPAEKRPPPREVGDERSKPKRLQP